MSELDLFLQRLPKTETHLHVEGALPYELLVEQDPDRFPPNPYFREGSYRYASFVEFENLLIDHALYWFDSAERYRIACKRLFEGMAAANIRYVETSFHLPMVEFIGVEGPEIVAAIKSAAPEGLQVRVIAGMVRNGYTESMRRIIDSLHSWEELDGIDLHGQEWLDLEDWAPPVWKRCAEAGKIVKAHAGELCGPGKVYEALDALGVRRIQHGVRSVEDPALLERLAAEGVALDVCPISNEKLGVFPELEQHSLRTLVEAGVVCSISTDDPLCFGNNLVSEYRTLSERMGFSREQLAQFARNGFSLARMDESLKRAYLREIDAVVARSS